MTKKLPAPRLQLRWEKRDNTDGLGSWACNYELVLPLRDGDIRRTEYGRNGRELKRQRDEFAVLVRQQFRASSSVPCTSAGTNTLHFDTPFRDGVHAQWDSEVLGNLPIFVIALDGTPIEKPRDTP